MEKHTLPGPSGKVLHAPEGLERTPDDLTVDELAYIFDFCVKYEAGDILQHGSGLSSALISQFAGLTVVENDEVRAKKLLDAAPRTDERYNYVVVKSPVGFEGSGTTQKFLLFIMNGLKEPTVAAFERLQASMNDAYEMSDVVMVANGLEVNALRLQVKYLAPFYNVVAIVPSPSGGQKDRYLVHWERNLLTKRKSVL